ncbi:hypothetical protein TCON_0977 [Astathelohania contejeani]|uniref:Phosphatidic acid phosphatase type 2/haloperoxidase domain-containing protein n=1 Tax=Astathelohania contejeani TaxID=164912 RepID=A0ABQ7I085_9MICR|nr:hypothetical protein TCON_0977 [Thelohania contejeani]
MYIIDKLFGFLPLGLFIYHLFSLFKENNGNNEKFKHIIQTSKSLIIMCVSNILKEYFQVERQIKSNLEKPEYLHSVILNSYIYLFGSNFSFPSTHSIFFTSYLISNRKTWNIFICILGIFSRVFYEHHTWFQAIMGIILGMAIELIIYFILAFRKTKKVKIV